MELLYAIAVELRYISTTFMKNYKPTKYNMREMCLKPTIMAYNGNWLAPKKILRKSASTKRSHWIQNVITG